MHITVLCMKPQENMIKGDPEFALLIQQLWAGEKCSQLLYMAFEFRCENLNGCTLYILGDHVLKCP